MWWWYIYIYIYIYIHTCSLFAPHGSQSTQTLYYIVYYLFTLPPPHSASYMSAIGVFALLAERKTPPALVAKDQGDRAPACIRQRKLEQDAARTCNLR